jgi:hypothetical protein
MGDNILSREDLAGNSGIGIRKPDVMTPFLPVYEYKNVKRDEKIIDDGSGCPVAVIVSNG